MGREGAGDRAPVTGELGDGEFERESNQVSFLDLYELQDSV